MTKNGDSDSSAGNWDVAFYADSGGSTSYTAQTFYGYLYNWYGATAGTGTSTMDSGNATSSVCPSPFRLPVGGDTASTNDFAILNGAMAGVAPTTLPSYYAGWQWTGAWEGVFSGIWTSEMNYQGSDGFYWSSTASSATHASYVYFYSNGVDPASYGNKYNGFAVRCVL
jgi:uncharacterized protein (TIGR02145 family)